MPNVNTQRLVLITQVYFKQRFKSKHFLHGVNFTNAVKTWNEIDYKCSYAASSFLCVVCQACSNSTLRCRSFQYMCT